MTNNDLIKNYDAKIKVIARKVAKENTAIVDDLAQLGRLKLLNIYDKWDATKGTLWTYAARVIEREMWRKKGDVIDVPDNRRGKAKIVRVELDDTMPAKQERIIDPEWESMLTEIENEVEALPANEKTYAKAYLEYLSGGHNRPANDKGKTIINRIATAYRKRFDDLAER